MAVILIPVIITSIHYVFVTIYPDIRKQKPPHTLTVDERLAGAAVSGSSGRLTWNETFFFFLSFDKFLELGMP